MMTIVSSCKGPLPLPPPPPPSFFRVYICNHHSAATPALDCMASIVTPDNTIA